MEPKIDRSVFRNLSYGLYLVTSADEGRLNGQVINTLIQVTSDPPRVAVIINKKNFTHELILKSKLFFCIGAGSIYTHDFLRPFWL